MSPEIKPAMSHYINNIVQIVFPVRIHCASLCVGDGYHLSPCLGCQTSCVLYMFYLLFPIVTIFSFPDNTLYMVVGEQWGSWSPQNEEHLAHLHSSLIRLHHVKRHQLSCSGGERPQSTNCQKYSRTQSKYVSTFT